MKKILPRLALLAAPFLVYFALFFAFEPLMKPEWLVDADEL